MKGCVFDIRHYSVHDGPGIRTSVFLKGCPLRCRWCHNPEGLEPEPVQVCRERQAGGKTIRNTETIGKSMTPDEVVKEVLKSRIFFEESEGGVTFTGGEPLMQPEFTEACLLLMKQEHIHTALDTCGYVSPDNFIRIAARADLILFDLKHCDSGIHQQFTGVPAGPVLTNLRASIEAGFPLIVRIPLIPGFNLSTDTLISMAGYLRETGWSGRVNLLPYHHIAIHKYEKLGMDYGMKNIRPPSAAEVEQAAKIFRERGFVVNIGG
jgi:pyruvate formate lyase activating enzyme